MPDNRAVEKSRIAIHYESAEYSFAANELASYIWQITGRNSEIFAYRQPPSEYTRIFLIGAPKRNFITFTLDGQLNKKISKSISREQSFVVYPIKSNLKQFVILAGSDHVSTLYAVYAYLEQFCHVGFFEDGEHVPKGNLPFDGKPFLSSPRFFERKAPWNLNSGHWGIKKFYPRFWSLDEIKRHLRWTAKRRMNMLFADMTMENGATYELARQVCDELGYPIAEPKEEEIYVSGFPIGWTWRLDMRFQMIKDALSYARSLGIRAIYALYPGEVPREFKIKYPQFKYIEDADKRWDHAQIHPDDPLYHEFTKKYIRKIVEAFGTDHFYFGNPYAEMTPESSPSKNFDLKTKASLSYLELLKEIDEKAVWVMDSWDFFWNRKTWTPARVKKYLEKIPTESFYMYDVNPDNRGVPVFQEYGYFYGKNWAFGVMHSAAGMDQIHGDIQNLLNLAKHAATSPLASKCRGFFLVPELTCFNPLFFDFLSGLAWEPRNTTVGRFLDDFALRRYGAKKDSVLRSALDDIAESLYTREVNTPIYNLGVIKWIWKNTPPFIPLYIVPRLFKALVKFTTQIELQKNNPLYENDMITYTKALLAQIAEYHFHRANSAYAEGDAETFKTESSACLKCIEWIAKILSTRRDCSIDTMIKYVMKAPGTNRYTPKMILQGTINWDYCCNDSYEQVANYDLPRMKNYFDGLKKAMKRKSLPIDLWKTVENLRPNHDDWIKSKNSLERSVIFRGKTMDAITKAFDFITSKAPSDLLKGGKIQRGKKVAWSSIPSSKNGWRVGMKGAKLGKGVISSDPAVPFGTYMYKEWVDMPAWGTVRTGSKSKLSSINLKETPLLTIRYRIRKGADPFHLWAIWKGVSGAEYRTRVWRSFAKSGTDTIDLLHALSSHGELPAKLLSLEFNLLRPPHVIEIKSVKVTN